MMPAVLLVALLCLNAPATMMMANGDGNNDSYLEERNAILKREKVAFLGGNLDLSQKEHLVNDLILKRKKEELSYDDPSMFAAGLHFFQGKKFIERSKVFEIIKKVPKGGSLHTHLLAGVNVDYFINNFTYGSNVYGCDLNGTFKLKVLQDPSQDKNCTWKPLKTYRENDPNFDDWLRSKLSLVVNNPEETYKTPKDVWQPFKKIFTTQYDLVCHKPIFEEYVRELLNELYQDNVVYTELRSTFMPLYETNGTVYDNENFFRIFIAAVENFKKDHPKFLGAKFIFSVYRGVSAEDLKLALKELLRLKKIFPDFIAGFDFVGYEEEGHFLLDFKEVLQEFSQDLKFFFHAGETNWFGHTDLNLIDAILLGTTRIGHGFALSKHPLLANITKERAIALEVCPISNQVLLLIKDLRNHPIVNLMAQGFPIVLCNDDPSVWEASGLSYDWYVAFMAMTPQTAGIEILKQLAMNSIIYSGMGNEDKFAALDKWKLQWEEFLDQVLASNT